MSPLINLEIHVEFYGVFCITLVLMNAQSARILLTSPVFQYESAALADFR